MSKGTQIHLYTTLVIVKKVLDKAYEATPFTEEATQAVARKLFEAFQETNYPEALQMRWEDTDLEQKDKWIATALTFCDDIYDYVMTANPDGE